jgi:hypothetical protein
MKIIIRTLVDITETGSRRGEDPIKSKQQANYNTTIQTAGFRANLIPGKCLMCFDEVNKIGFGHVFKGKHNYWELSLQVDYEEAITHEMLIGDFDLVPIVCGLQETAKFDKDVYRSQGKETNIVFEILDN